MYIVYCYGISNMTSLNWFYQDTKNSHPWPSRGASARNEEFPQIVGYQNRNKRGMLYIINYIVPLCSGHVIDPITMSFVVLNCFGLHPHLQLRDCVPRAQNENLRRLGFDSSQSGVNIQQGFLWVVLSDEIWNKIDSNWTASHRIQQISKCIKIC